MTLQQIGENRCFEGRQLRYSHESHALGCEMLGLCVGAGGAGESVGARFDDTNELNESRKLHGCIDARELDAALRAASLLINRMPRVDDDGRRDDVILSSIRGRGETAGEARRSGLA